LKGLRTPKYRFKRAGKLRSLKKIEDIKRRIARTADEEWLSGSELSKGGGFVEKGANSGERDCSKLHFDEETPKRRGRTEKDYREETLAKARKGENGKKRISLEPAGRKVLPE